MPFGYATRPPVEIEQPVMRFASVLILAAIAAAAPPAEAQRFGREQDRALEGRRHGDHLPLDALIARVRIPGANFIGAELVGPGVYRLKYMRGTDVIWIDVDARSGRVLGRVR
jgi:hypothetical protein